ncbi:N-acetyltransferase family protein [Cellulomonas sp. 179-A 9B4 NHS]|uniref:GNAT family N-acetyltransferase n=1 Tax=Cellulomonas sp. 179-A 9B4 NHS TaxID=3142379 RepID=UPI00399F6D9B
MAAQDGADVVVRTAEADDVPAVCRFGATHVAAHYAPILGPEGARAQVRQWWGDAYVGRAVADGVVLVAERAGELAGVAQHGRLGDDHVVWKLYVHPDHRGTGLGPRLLRAVADRLPPDADRLWVEHVAANVRAGAFYEREGFTVQRVETHPSGDDRHAVVWRSRPLRA